MTPKGRNLLIQPETMDKITKGGILIPDTATPPNMQWGTVVKGHGEIEEGSRVLFYGRKSYEEENIKLVARKKIIIWDYEA